MGNGVGRQALLRIGEAKFVSPFGGQFGTVKILNV